MFFQQPPPPRFLTPQQVAEIEAALRVLVRYSMMSESQMEIYMANVRSRQEVIEAEWRLIK